MATLSALSQLDTQRGRQVLALLLQHSPFFRFMEDQSAFAEGATDFTSRPVDAETTVQTRTVGGNYTSGDVTPAAEVPGSLGFHGDSFDVDRSHAADDERGLGGVDAFFRKYFPRRVRDWAKGIERLAVRGSGVDDASGREMEGLLTILDGTSDLSGFPGHTGVVDAVDFLSTSPNSLDLTDEANWDDFMEGIEQLMYMIGASGILMNRQLGAKMTTIARENHIRGERRDRFGEPITTYDGTDLVRLNDGSITNTEPDNASEPNNNTTSLVLAAPAEGSYEVVTNSGVEYDDFDRSVLEEKRSERAQWEIRCENNIEEKWAVLRVRNIKVPSGTENMFG
jgi:hypothetical protein